jgi:N-acylneuraminate cytidylyltransferase
LSKKIVSLITARGGSKGIPNKNILNIGEKPLIQYTINVSQNSKVSETWVSTEDRQIKDVSEKCGAKVITRPKELSNDIIMPDAALVHFAKNYEFDILVFIQPTSPLLKSKYINMGLKMLNKYDSVFSAYKEHWQPRWTKDSQPYEWDINKRPRRQDKQELYVENGAFYITTKENLLESKLRYSKNIGIVEMPYYESFQVDNKDDLQLIKKLL